MSTETTAGATGPADERTATALKLWVVLARAFHAVSARARTDIERYGLRESEFAVLEALYHKGPLTLGEVGRKVLLTSGSITHVVNKLEERGLVARRWCDEDQRVCHAELREAGRLLMCRVFPAHAQAIAGAVSGLGVEEQRAATELLKRLGRSAGAGAGPDPGAARGVMISTFTSEQEEADHERH
jgi:MarR family transcriptional regulator, 2-MHQ and catechol-resistance regulon repressor